MEVELMPNGDVSGRSIDSGFELADVERHAVYLPEHLARSTFDDDGLVAAGPVVPEARGRTCPGRSLRPSLQRPLTRRLRHERQARRGGGHSCEGPRHSVDAGLSGQEEACLRAQLTARRLFGGAVIGGACTADV